MTINANDPNLKSFIDVACDHHFPIQNLPFGVFKPTAHDSARVGVAIGDYVVDLQVIQQQGLFAGIDLPSTVFAQNNLNEFLGLGKDTWRAVRQRVSELLRHDNPQLRDDLSLRQCALHEQCQVELLLPLKIGGYTDFYASFEHASNLGKMFRPGQEPLTPNWLYMPIAYDGRASTIVVSGTAFHRPCGQIKSRENEPPQFSPSMRLDSEVEVAFVIGTGNERAKPITVAMAPEHVFGVMLLSDWSARDIQKWEYVPLGPFLGKNFCTSVSPWIVTLDALEPFRVAARQQDPAPLAYLHSSRDYVYDLQLSMQLKTKQQGQYTTVSSMNYKHIYWDFCQQLAHHTSNGCQLFPGDIFASGTISNTTADSCGSLLEITWGGANPISFADGEQRTFLQDGDSLNITGYCQGVNYRVGLGCVEGTVLRAIVD